MKVQHGVAREYSRQPVNGGVVLHSFACVSSNRAGTERLGYTRFVFEALLSKDSGKIGGLIGNSECMCQVTGSVSRLIGRA